MASSVIFDDRLEIPYFRSLAEFRAWALSDDCPERGRIDYIGGQVEVDMSAENLFFHGSVKSEVARVLGNIAQSTGSGYVFTDCTRISCPYADLSAEPDVVYLSDEVLDSGRVRLVPSAGGEPDSFVELEGPPDLVVEIISDSSVAKDTRRLPVAYWQAGITEYWLIDMRGERLFFQVHSHGASNYEPVPEDAEGFQLSTVFARRFRLDRRRNARGRWVFELHERKEMMGLDG
jgi:Uma2 family endonuclease